MCVFVMSGKLSIWVNRNIVVISCLAFGLDVSGRVCNLRSWLYYFISCRELFGEMAYVRNVESKVCECVEEYYFFFYIELKGDKKTKKKHSFCQFYGYFCFGCLVHCSKLLWFYCYILACQEWKTVSHIWFK